MDESKRTLTKADLEALADVFDQRFQINTLKLTHSFATQEDLKELKDDLKQEFSHLPTKDEFYKSQDDLVTRLKKIDENTDVQAGQVVDHESRITRIESKLNITTA